MKHSIYILFGILLVAPSSFAQHPRNGNRMSSRHGGSVRQPSAPPAAKPAGYACNVRNPHPGGDFTLSTAARDLAAPQMTKETYLRKQEELIHESAPACNFFAITALCEAGYEINESKLPDADEMYDYLIGKGFVETDYLDLEIMFLTKQRFDAVAQRPAKAKPPHGHIMVPYEFSAEDNRVLFAEGDLGVVATETVAGDRQYMEKAGFRILVRKDPTSEGDPNSQFDFENYKNDKTNVIDNETVDNFLASSFKIGANLQTGQLLLSDEIDPEYCAVRSGEVLLTEAGRDKDTGAFYIFGNKDCLSKALKHSKESLRILHIHADIWDGSMNDAETKSYDITNAEFHDEGPLNYLRIPPKAIEHSGKRNNSERIEF